MAYPDSFIIGTKTNKDCQHYSYGQCGHWSLPFFGDRLCTKSLCRLDSEEYYRKLAWDRESKRQKFERSLYEKI